MKIGIITLHKVLNYGSALQAYALQKYLQKNTQYEVELIDYIYPNKEFESEQSISYQLREKIRVIKSILLKKRNKTIRAFRLFYENCFRLSGTSYYTINEVMTNPPLYDIYITGSDQVWNVEAMKNNPVMYCAFAPKFSKIVSFSASFTIKNLPDIYREEIKNRLSRYSCIGVREESSLNILKSLDLPNSIQTKCTCDPTLLLSADDYSTLSKLSSITPTYDYVLIYALEYAFNPDPALTNLIDDIQTRMKCKILYIGDYKLKRKYSNLIQMKGLGPCEFLYLVQHAKYVITSSFHGTMFSLIFRKSFMAIIPPREHPDCRISDILSVLGLENRKVYSDSEKVCNDFTNCYDNKFELRLNNYISESQNFLIKSVSIKNNND